MIKNKRKYWIILILSYISMTLLLVYMLRILL